MTKPEHISFISQDVRIGAQLVVPESGLARAGVVCVTGGQADAEALFTEWQQAMATEGIASLAFDARGKGRSDGVWDNGRMFGSPAELGNSQLSRMQDTVNAIVEFQSMDVAPAEPSLLGASMGGDVALHAAYEIPDRISSLILKAPAAYHPDAHTAQFGTQLRAILRNPARYPHALAPNFGMLRRLAVPTRLVFAAGEEVISPDIREMYTTAADENPLVESLVVGDETTRHGYFFATDPTAIEAKRKTITNTTAFILKTTATRVH